MKLGIGSPETAHMFLLLVSVPSHTPQKIYLLICYLPELIFGFTYF
jgi:hypothetical protein